MDKESLVKEASLELQAEKFVSKAIQKLAEQKKETYPVSRTLTSLPVWMTAGAIGGTAQGIVSSVIGKGKVHLPTTLVSAGLGAGVGTGWYALLNWANRTMSARALKGRQERNKGLYDSERRLWKS